MLIINLAKSSTRGAASLCAHTITQVDGISIVSINDSNITEISDIELILVDTLK